MQCLRTLLHIQTINSNKAEKNNITVVEHNNIYANEGECQSNDEIDYVEKLEINKKIPRFKLMKLYTT